MNYSGRMDGKRTAIPGARLGWHRRFTGRTQLREDLVEPGADARVDQSGEAGIRSKDDADLTHTAHIECVSRRWEPW